MRDRGSKDDAQEFHAPTRGDDQVYSGSNQDFDYPTDADNKKVEYAAPDWSEDNPIPVFIVKGEADIPVINNASYERYALTDAAVEIAGAKRTRTRMIIKADKGNTDEVYIDRDVNISTAFSYRLDPGEFVELNNNDRLWGRCAPTKTGNVSVIQEYDVPLDIPRHV